MTGYLTIRDVTLPVTLGVEYEGTTRDATERTRAAFSAKTVIDRDRFGITWNMPLEAGGVVVGNRVQVEIEIQAILSNAERRAA